VKITLGAGKLGRSACFDLGQRVTEVGAAMSYATYFAGQITERPDALRDVSAGVFTAAQAADRLKGSLKGTDQKQAAAIAKEAMAFNEELRQKWLAAPAVRKPLTPKDMTAIQRKTGEIRKKVTDLWDASRMKCGGPGKAPLPETTPKISGRR
jgi:hypothetical protein